MTDLTSRVAARFQPQATKTGEVLALRVAARFQRQAGSLSKWDGKLVGKDCRLQWSDHMFYLEELPQKGKKKLRVAELQTLHEILRVSFTMPSNVLRDAKLGRSDSYDAIKKKLLKAVLEGRDEAGDQIPEWAHKQKAAWYESQVYFLEVTPENVAPYKAKGKDFTVHVSWTDFSAYGEPTEAEIAHSMMGDPSGSSLKSKSKGAARKFYKTLQAEPNALKGVSWQDFTKWLDTKKIGYDWRHSVWR